MVSDFYSSEFDEETSDSKSFIQKSKLIIIKIQKYMLRAIRKNLISLIP